MNATASTPNNENSIHYPGWGILAAAFTGVMVSFAPIVPYTFSLFLDPLHASFGWNREALGGAFALAAITVALVSPGIGALLDRFPPRRIILPAILLFALALASLSRLTAHIGQFYLTFFALGLVANGTAQFAYTRTVLTWFSKRRGFALALLLSGSGVGSMLVPPLTQWMIQHHGWRSAFLLLGGIALLGFPLTAMLVRNRPEPAIARVDNRVAGITVAAALRRAAFWILVFITIF
jgi:sugar phosphate permease